MPLTLEGPRQLLSLVRGGGTPLEMLEFNEKSLRLDVDEESWNSFSQLVGTLILNNEVYIVPR